MKMWEGLGYYTRARNLHATAKFIAYERNGQFPDTYEDILALKGIGSYTAAAIASFAYDLPYAVLDGNVYRVLARVFGIETPIDSLSAKKEYAHLAQETLAKNCPADFNQAMMDFGATHCTPNQPKCKSCIMLDICAAYANKKVAILPIKAKKIVRQLRYFNYLVLNIPARTGNGQSVFIRKRTEKDIWQDLYEFPLIETEALIETDALEPLLPSIYKAQATANFPTRLSFSHLKTQSKPYHQVLTHQKIVAIFWEFNFPEGQDIHTLILTGKENDKGFQKIDWQDLRHFAFPKIIDTYLKEKVLNLF
jgi:A/G-specific adenine glycosylase